MNLFFLEYDFDLIAKSHCDRHVVKIILEATQMLSTASHECGCPQGYLPTHRNHPMTKWVGRSLSNWFWTYEYALSLCEEYKYRYGRTHKTYYTLMSLQIPKIDDIGLTSAPQCVPNFYKSDDLIKTYRNYYIGEKARFCTWKKRDIPEWFNYNGVLLR